MTGSIHDDKRYSVLFEPTKQPLSDRQWRWVARFEGEEIGQGNSQPAMVLRCITHRNVLNGGAITETTETK